MRNAIVYSFVITFIFGFYEKGMSQGAEIGRPCPEFTFTRVEHYATNQVKLSDLRGSWVVLYLWSEYCGSCIHHLPDDNRLYKSLEGKVRFFLVTDIRFAKNDTDGQLKVRKLFEKYRRIYGLSMPVVYDTSFCNTVNADGYPYSILISPDGIVKAITNSLKKDQIDDIMNDKARKIPLAFNNYKPRPALNNYMPFLTSGALSNGGLTDTSFAFRSLLTKWRPEMAQGYKVFFDVGNSVVLEAIRAPLEDLFNWAYFGKTRWGFSDEFYLKYYRKPILEISDSTLFKFDRNLDDNMFCYSISVPKKDDYRHTIMSIMQDDLKNYFGYVAEIQQRKMPYLKLISLPGAEEKLSRRIFEDSNYIFVLKNVSTKLFVSRLSRALDIHEDWDIEDCTSIKSLISIALNSEFNNLTDLNNELTRYGLQLVKDTKEMNVLVVKSKTR